MVNTEGKLIVVAAPSGAGKTSIVQGLLKKHSFLDFSVSATTRAKRSHEIHGKDYFFFTLEEFDQKKKAGEFLEYEEVYPGAFYGTLHAELDRIWGAGKSIIFDVDVIGALTIKQTFGDRCLNLFVKPPSLFSLYKRLKNRKTETEESLRKRIGKAEKEMSFQSAFDITVVNDVLEDAIDEASKHVQDFLS